MKWLTIIAIATGSFALGGCETVSSTSETGARPTAADQARRSMMRQKRQGMKSSGYTFYGR